MLWIWNARSMCGLFLLLTTRLKNSKQVTNDIKKAEWQQKKGIVDVCRDYEPTRKTWLMHVEVMLQQNSNCKVSASYLEHIAGRILPLNYLEALKQKTSQVLS